jgi:hypothetical protein
MERNMRRILPVVLLAMLLLPFSNGPASSGEKEVADAYQKAISAPDDPGMLDDFLRTLPVVTDNEGGALRTYYVFEGDLLQTRAQIQAALRNRSQAPVSAGVLSGELLVNMANGQPTIWAKNERKLTYAIDRDSFGSSARYSEVMQNMVKATKDWETACVPCGIAFEYKSELDTGTNFSAVTFVVRFKPDETSFIAASFFPNDPPFRRVLVVAPSYFTTNVDHVGVFRHELGHVLGYRHEHIQGIAGCFSEGGEWRPLTPYDPHSAMHYMCGGGGTLKLDLTAMDVAGHTKAYAP